jgi:hypothetical protein
MESAARARRRRFLTAAPIDSGESARIAGMLPLSRHHEGVRR